MILDSETRAAETSIYVSVNRDYSTTQPQQNTDWREKKDPAHSEMRLKLSSSPQLPKFPGNGKYKIKR